ncbi:MAG: ABC transporter ATP-binding protein [Paracoccaceae bacterium]
MIEFRNVSKYYLTPNGRKTLLNNFSQVIPAGSKVALVGRNGAGKSTMISMIAGSLSPNSGSIARRGSVSWPLGFAGSFAVDLSGAQNTRFVARIYGIDTEYLIDYVNDFAELGDFMRMPVRTYSSGMKARLAFGLSMGVAFDWYLVDEITAVGDASFRKKSLEVFQTRLKTSGLLMVSHSTATLRDYCTSGIVLNNGVATFYDDIEAAIKQHDINMAA